MRLIGQTRIACSEQSSIPKLPSADSIGAYIPIKIPNMYSSPFYICCHVLPLSHKSPITRKRVNG